MKVERHCDFARGRTTTIVMLELYIVLQHLTYMRFHLIHNLTREKQREHPSSGPKIGRVDKGLIHFLIPDRLFHLQPDAQSAAPA
ncbi:hypothetical protein E4V51_11070 [Paenibacillus sp. 28ISP30-2]|nr:hypothetical protein [Paenibacillus sp. 23TSA30-6]MBE0341652.1 hypothetical protein [Paenibacillus sp. 28ISP30-2]